MNKLDGLVLAALISRIPAPSNRIEAESFIAALMGLASIVNAMFPSIDPASLQQRVLELAKLGEEAAPNAKA